MYSISLIFTREKSKITNKCYRNVSYFTVMENTNKMGYNYWVAVLSGCRTYFQNPNPNLTT